MSLIRWDILNKKNIMKVKEIWKDIVGFECLYQISNYGNIKSCKRYVPHSRFIQKLVPEKILSLGKDKDGYLMAILCRDATKKTVKVHRLVADAFLEKIKDKNIVNHIDSNKSNNFFQNLELVSNLENSCHSRLKMKTSSNYVGVSFNKKDKVFRATIRHNGKNICLGGFKNEEEAYKSRCDFEIKNQIKNKYLKKREQT
jgi:hypothetical protein